MTAREEAADLLEALAAERDAALAREAKLTALIRRVVDDPHWRTNDNTLWPDLCAALQEAAK